MADDSRKLSITYSSGLIPPPEHISTLAVFYDEIWLPYPYNFSPHHVQIHSGSLEAGFDRLGLGYVEQALIMVGERFLQQRDSWRLLFVQDILRTLPPYDDGTSNPTSKLLMLDNAFESLKGKNTYLGDIGDWLYHLILELHMLYAIKPSPELLIPDTSNTNTSRLAYFLVQSLFQYQIPRLETLNAEQVLEVRDYLKDTKEGFTQYVNEMTDDVEQRLKGGNLSEIGAAQKTFERKILPQYEEFRRQLVSRKTGYWANVLSASADFLKVDATPWTPKFYGELLKWLGVALNLTAKDEEALLTNKSQAFQYLVRLSLWVDLI